MEEYLYYFPNGRQAKIFDRKEEGVTIGDSFKKELETALSNILKVNRLFLSCAANFSSVKEIEDVFLFFKDDVVIYPNEPNNWLSYSVEILSKDENYKFDFMNFMKRIGTGLVNIQTKLEHKRLDRKELPEDMPEILKGIIASQDADLIEAKLDYKGFTLDLQEESNGIKKLFEVLCPLINIIVSDKVLVWDELETSFHPCIVTEIIEMFQKGKIDSKSQFIFTTHDINLLDLQRFRRDQIWFTELNESSRATDLYSLSDLKNVRKDENIQKGYISGKYGAIPCVSSQLADMFSAR